MSDSGSMFPVPGSRFNRQADMRNEIRPSVPHSDLERLVIDLHMAYTRRTGFDITLTLDRQRMWREWISFREPAFTAADLELVIGYLRAHIARGERNDGALKFLNLIGRVDQFEEDLALARRWRKPQAARSTAAAPVQTHGHESDDRTPEQRAAEWAALKQSSTTVQP